MKFNLTDLISTDSTNNEIRKLAESGAPEGTAISSKIQTDGKGSRGRRFISPDGGLYLSLLLRPDKTEHITAMAAVAGARAIISLCNADVGIKWTNDLYLNGKKISGILTESSINQDGKPAYVILGIGINIKCISFTGDLVSKATSLEIEGYQVDRFALASAFLNEFDRIYSHNADWLDFYREKSVVLGKKITVISSGEEYEATAESIDRDGHLIVVKENGESISLFTGEVSIFGNYGTKV